MISNVDVTPVMIQINGRILENFVQFSVKKLKEHNFVSPDRVHSSSPSSQQMWPLPFG